jgi:hypothetical protein
MQLAAPSGDGAKKREERRTESKSADKQDAGAVAGAGPVDGSAAPLDQKPKIQDKRDVQRAFATPAEGSAELAEQEGLAREDLESQPLQARDALAEDRATNKPLSVRTDRRAVALRLSAPWPVRQSPIEEAAPSAAGSAAARAVGGAVGVRPGGTFVPKSEVNRALDRGRTAAMDAVADGRAAKAPSGGGTAEATAKEQLSSAEKMVRVLFVLRAVPPAGNVANIVDADRPPTKAARRADVQQASEAEAAEAVMEAAPSPVP